MSETKHTQWKLVPEIQFEELYEAARRLCEYGPDETMRERLRVAGQDFARVVSRNPSPAASPADAGLLEEAMKVMESAAQKLRACRGTCSSYGGLGPIVRDIDALLERAKGATT